MGKVVFSKDYGYRKVIRVVTNPSDPKWLHEDRSTPAAAHTGDTVEAQENGRTICNNCRYNWHEEEFLWTGSELLGNDGEPKTNDVLLAEVRAGLEARSPIPPGREIAALQDAVV